MEVFHSRFTLVVFLIFRIWSLIQALEYELTRFEAVENPDKIWNTSTLKIIRLSRGVYALNGVMDLLQELGENDQIGAKLYYSTNGVAKYSLTPVRLVQNSICHFINVEYKKYLKDFALNSDFPIVGDKYYCPLQKSHYEIRHFVWDINTIPTTLKQGFYKVIVTFKTATGDESNYNFYVKVT